MQTAPFIATHVLPCISRGRGPERLRVAFACLCTAQRLTLRYLVEDSTSHVRLSDAQVYGINLTSVLDDVTSIPQINQTLAYFSSPAGIAAIQSVNNTISTASVADLQQASGNFSQINGVSCSLLSENLPCVAASHTQPISASSSFACPLHFTSILEGSSQMHVV